METPIETWKQIANFLSSLGGPSSERMARYLGDQGMPVYQRSRGGRVQAMPSELRAWWEAQRRLVGARHVADWCHRLPRGRGKSAKRKAA